MCARLFELDLGTPDSPSFTDSAINRGARPNHDVHALNPFFMLKPLGTKSAVYQLVSLYQHVHVELEILVLRFRVRKPVVSHASLRAQFTPFEDGVGRRHGLARPRS